MKLAQSDGECKRDSKHSCPISHRRGWSCLSGGLQQFVHIHTESTFDLRPHEEKGRIVYEEIDAYPFRRLDAREGLLHLLLPHRIHDLTQRVLIDAQSEVARLFSIQCCDTMISNRDIPDEGQQVLWLR